MAHVDPMEALDRYGSDLSSWPDVALAQEARHRALADPAFRARLDDATALSTGLDALRDALDVELAGLTRRTAESVLLAVPRRRGSARRWAMVAAAVVVAAALGAVVDLTILAPVGSPPYDVVVLDPLFLDPAATLSP